MDVWFRVIETKTIRDKKKIIHEIGSTSISITDLSPKLNRTNVRRIIKTAEKKIRRIPDTIKKLIFSVNIKINEKINEMIGTINIFTDSRNFINHLLSYQLTVIIIESRYIFNLGGSSNVCRWFITNSNDYSDNHCNSSCSKTLE